MLFFSCESEPTIPGGDLPEGILYYKNIHTTTQTTVSNSPLWTFGKKSETLSYNIAPADPTRAMNGITIDGDTGVISVDNSLSETNSGSYIVTVTDTNTSTVLRYISIEIKVFTKLGTNGYPLGTQSGTWSNDGTEAAGTQWACVKDADTGLIWEIKTEQGKRRKDFSYVWGGPTAEGYDASNRVGTYYDDWKDIVEDANSGNGLCGYTDWRVPRREELRSIADYSRYAPAINIAVFPKVQWVPWGSSLGSSGYWAASPLAYENNYASSFSYSYGYASGYLRSSLEYIRLVRDGQSNDTTTYLVNKWPDSRYTDHGDGTVTDTETGLMWKQCSEGLSGSDCSGSAKTYTYSEAVALEGTNFAGYSDWRVPTLKELSSLLATDRYDPAINSTMFPNTVTDSYRTSTLLVDTPDYFSWELHFNKGNNGHGNNDEPIYLRLVRAGK